MGGPRSASPKLSISSVPLPPRRTRSHSSTSEGDFPPPIRRTSTDASGAPRPVPFAAKFQKVHPGTTGVTVLEHLERLDAVEASLQRLAVDEDDTEEVDVGESSQTQPIRVQRNQTASGSSSSAGLGISPFSPPGSPLATVIEVDVPSSRSSMSEEDLVAMSKSTSHVEGTPGGRHARWASQGGQGLDWIQNPEPTNKRTVIVEVRMNRDSL